jgi:glycosyltransferase involved in cell wall biosynthesis
VARGRELEGDMEGAAEDSTLAEMRDFFAELERRGELDKYFATAKERVRADSVVFTGYLTHRELRFLFPCCDVGIFPSVVREAGPLVFLEALASGCFPLGTYTGGMAASIDAVSSALGDEAASAMKLDPVHTTRDVVLRVPQAIALAPRYRAELNRVARETYDWFGVAGILRQELAGM